MVQRLRGLLKTVRFSTLDLLFKRRHVLDVQDKDSEGREEVLCQSPVLLPFIFQSLRHIKIDLQGHSLRNTLGLHRLLF